MKGPKGIIKQTPASSSQKPAIRRGRHNQSLYNSYKWRVWRARQLDRIGQQQWDSVRELPVHIRMQVLNNPVTCAICLDLAKQGAYDTVQPGKTLDHILCLNPDNWKDTLGGIFGKAFDQDNVQPMCATHHSRKSRRDQAYQARHETH